MKSFKDIAYQILQEEKKPLHYRELTEIASSKGLLKTDGKTPWATMNAQLSVDIIKKGQASDFIRTDPGYFAINPLKKAEISHGTDTFKVKYRINDKLSPTQKGDVAEARVAELITLYGKEGLTCYRPVSDDEGIDLIVKKRDKLEVVYVQVKSTYGYPSERGFVSSVKESAIVNKIRNILVFVYFDELQGDLYDHIFCIPAPDFLRLTHNENKKPGHRVFTVGLNNPDRSKYAEFMIEKRELANRILEIMERL
jgi:hypothetical protein